VTEDPIDPEKLAAFLDGTLSEAERAEVLRQLARSRRAFETLAGAAAILSEIDEGSKAVRRGSWLRPVPGSSRWLVQRAAIVVLPMVVVATVMALAIPGLRSYNADAVVLAGIVLPVTSRSPAAVLSETWHESPWSGARGGTERVDAFRLGARVMTLELAWQYDTGVADTLRDEIVDMLTNVDGAALIAARYGELSAQSSGSDRRTALEDLRETLLDSPWFDLGVWTQAALFAVGAKNAAFFETGESRRTLRGLVSRLSSGEGSPSIAPVALDQIKGLIRRGVQDAEWEGMRSALISIAQQSAG
jgi:hypothetical protein